MNSTVAYIIVLLAGTVIVVRLVVWAVRVFRRVLARRAYQRVQHSHRLDRMVNEVCREYLQPLHNSSLAVGISKDGNLLECVNFSDDERAEDVTDRSLFEIGSVTKLFTALLVARCSVLWPNRLASTLNDIAPALVPSDSPIAGVTLRELATHTSGLPRLPRGLYWINGGWRDPYRDYDRAALERSLLTTRLRRWSRGKYRYSNYGYALLGQSCAIAASRDFKALLSEQICRPLNLSDTFYLPASVTPKLLIPGRNRRGHTVKNWHFDAVAPAGGLVSSLKDIVKFIGFHLSPDDDWRESVNLCLRVHHRMSASQAIGLGWHLHRDRISGEEVWWHNGATGGYRSFVGIVLSHRLGVAVLNNCGPFGWRVKNLTTLGFQILRFAMKLDW